MSGTPTPAPAATTEPKKEEENPVTGTPSPEAGVTPPAATTEPKKEEAASFLGDEPAKEENSFAAPNEVEPVEFELELPEDSLVPDEEFDALVEEATKEGLTQKEAEARLKLLDSAYSKAKEAFVKSESTRLLQELLADPEFSTPEKQKEARANIDRVYAAYKDPDFMKFVKGNPLIGNNKHFVKFLAKLGQSLAPEGAPAGNGAAAPSKSDGDMYEYYPSMRPQN